jgi:hypothetical protein
MRRGGGDGAILPGKSFHARILAHPSGTLIVRRR